MNEMMEAVKNGKIKAKWEMKEFNQPGAKGFFIQGLFGTNEALEPIEPLKPSKRRPLPENPFEIPDNARNETREPLTDVFEEKDAIKIYAELPGEEKEDIKLHVTEKSVEIKAKNFQKIVDLPKTQIAPDNTSSQYKNGVLEITIPKSKQLRLEDKGKTKMV
ncbi:MAG: Hsp20/alpha crystallin family protein [Candidatus Bathyarchaeia archaeon]|jgi:HSP20 family molecular chaperone IbpA